MLDTIINYRFGKTDSSIYNSLLDVDLLIIDDLGTECLNNMKFTELFTVLNTRLLNQNNKITKTIISTNLSIQNLFKKLRRTYRFPTNRQLQHLPIFRRRHTIHTC